MTNTMQMNAKAMGSKYCNYSGTKDQQYAQALASCQQQYPGSDGADDTVNVNACYAAERAKIDGATSTGLPPLVNDLFGLAESWFGKGPSATTKPIGYTVPPKPTLVLGMPAALGITVIILGVGGLIWGVVALSNSPAAAVK